MQGSMCLLIAPSVVADDAYPLSSERKDAVAQLDIVLEAGVTDDKWGAQ